MFLDSVLPIGWKFGRLPPKRPKKSERQDKSAAIVWLYLPKNKLKNGKTFLHVVFFFNLLQLQPNLLFLVLDPDSFDQRPNSFVLGGRKIFKGVGNAVPIRVNPWWKRQEWRPNWGWPQACHQHNNKDDFLHVKNTRTRLCGRQAPDMRFSARCLQFLSAFILYSREIRRMKRKPRSGTLRHICSSIPGLVTLGKRLPSAYPKRLLYTVLVVPQAEDIEN